MSFLDKIFKKDEKESEAPKKSESKKEEEEETKQQEGRGGGKKERGGSQKGINYRSILKRPVITEKSRDMSMEGKYVFMVDIDANKKRVQQEVEDRWGVVVESVNTMTTKKRGKRIPGRRGEGSGKIEKKAIVTLREGDKIDVFPV